MIHLNLLIFNFIVPFIGLIKWYGSHIKGFKYNRVLSVGRQQAADFGQDRERQGDNIYEESIWHCNGVINLMYCFLREGGSDE